MSKTWLIDAVERVLWTYTQAFLGLIIAVGIDTLSLGTLKAAAIAAIPAGLSALKTLVAKFVGDPNSAALGVEPPAPPVLQTPVQPQYLPPVAAPPAQPPLVQPQPLPQAPVPQPPPIIYAPPVAPPLTPEPPIPPLFAPDPGQVEGMGMVSRDGGLTWEPWMPGDDRLDPDGYLDTTIP